ncbi:hypothetical protein ABPG72_021217 [Tetrahymena utriculariae]
MQSDRSQKYKFNSRLDNAEVRLNLKAVRINYVNNLVIDKEQMVQLILNTCEMETDIDFYRKYDSFYVKQNNDNQEFTTLLIANDKIAEEFYSEEEESADDEQEALDTLNPASNIPKKISRSSIQALDSFLDEQKISSQTSLVSARNQQRKNTQQQQQQSQTPNQNSSNPNSTIIMNDKIQLFKESNNQQNNSLQKDYRINSQIEEDSHNQADVFFTINDFELMKEFIRYFSKSDYPNILEQCNRLSQKRQRVIIKRRKKTFRKNTIFQSPAANRRNRLQTRLNTFTSKVENISIRSNLANQQQASQNNNIDKTNQSQEYPNITQNDNKSSFFQSPEIPKSSFFKKKQ